VLKAHHIINRDKLKWDYGSWPGGLSKKDGANALSGAGSLDTATTHLNSTSRTKNLSIEYYEKWGWRNNDRTATIWSASGSRQACSAGGGTQFGGLNPCASRSAIPVAACFSVWFPRCCRVFMDVFYPSVTWLCTSIWCYELGGQTAFKIRAVRHLHYFCICANASTSNGTHSAQSATMPISAQSKIGALASVLIASTVPAA
jgi:hypothetical protein